MPNIIFSVAERVEMVRQREQGNSYRRIMNYFAEKYPGRRVPSAATIRTTVMEFYKTGNLDVRKMTFSYPSRQLSKEMKSNICLKAEEDPSKPASQIARELKVSKTSVQKVLNSAKIRFCESKIGEKSSSPAHDQSEITFSQTMIDRLKTDQRSLRRVCFSNESTILYVSKSNKQNVLLCSWRIQHRLINRNETEYQKLHVWVGAVGQQPIGPFFIEGILNGERYLKMLREEIVPALKALDKNDPVIWYQQPGAPPYYTADVFAYLNQEFPGWIGRGRRSQRSTRALDMSLLDHALSGRLKNILYAGEQIEDLSVLRNKVSGIIASMDPHAICNTIRAHHDRDLRQGVDVDS